MKPGATSSTCAHARSAIASRSAGQSLGGRRAAAPTARTATRRGGPAARALASSADGSVSSTSGRSGTRPARAASNAASSASRSAAPTWIVPRCSGPGPRGRAAAERGQPVEREVDLHAAAAEVELRDARARSVVGQVARAEPAEQRARAGRRPRPRRGASIAVPSASTTPRTAPLATSIRATGAASRISAPASRAAAAIASESAAHAALDVGPHAARAAGVAHHVVEEHVAGARRRGRRRGADHRVGRERRAQRLALEPALELGPRGAEQRARARAAGRRAAATRRAQRARASRRSRAPQARRVGRRRVEQRLEPARDRGRGTPRSRDSAPRRGARTRRSSRASASAPPPSSSPRPSGSGVNDDGERGSRRSPWRASPSSRTTTGRSSPAT